MDGVSVVIVSHNSARYLEQCLASVVGRGHEVVVVDSGSDDGSVELVRGAFPEVEVIALAENVGYAHGNNIGFASTSGTYVLVLNPDAWPLGHAIDRLVEAADASPRAAILGPRLRTLTGGREQSIRGFPTVWRLATEFLFLRWLAPRSRALNAFYGAGADDARGPVEWVVGAAMLVRREAADDVGGFDASYFLYDEEIDLAYRLRARGWHVLYCPRAEFMHAGGASAPRSALLCELLRSHIRFLHKHHGAATARRARSLLLVAMLLRGRVFRGERRRAARESASWLRRNDVASMLASSAPTATKERRLRETE